MDNTTFGGIGRGFTIEGGDDYGVYFSGGSNLTADDIDVKATGSHQEIAGVYLYYCPGSVRLVRGDISGQNSLGVYVYNSDVGIEDCYGHGVADKGIYVDYWSEPNLEDVDIDTCSIGLEIQWADITYDGGTITECTTGIKLYVPLAITVALDDIDVYNCATGILTYGYYYEYPITLNIDYFECWYCTTAVSLNGTDFTMTNSEIYDIYDTGIVATHCGDPMSINSTNSLYDIDGDGINLGSDCVATIGANFYDIDGTAIICQTGEGNTTIQYADIDGTDWYEGIATSGTGTMVDIRNCQIYDFNADVSPTPRGVTAYKKTADLGNRTEDGDNDIYDNSLNLFYATKAARPESLYAIMNWWGSDPPNTSKFGGASGYIAYDPWQTTGPRLLGVDGNDLIVPDHLALNGAFPNPSARLVEIRCLIPDNSPVTLSIWDLQGRHIKCLIDSELPAGMFTTNWDGTDEAGSPVSAGIYVCRLQAVGGVDTRRVALIR